MPKVKKLLFKSLPANLTKLIRQYFEEKAAIKKAD